MKFLILLTLTLALQAESCYTVQLFTESNTVKKHKELSSKSYDETCRLMEIGSYLTVRCGCYDDEKEAKGTLVYFRENYKNASITRTYKYRFEDKITKEEEIEVPETKVETVAITPVVPLTIETSEIIKAEEPPVESIIVMPMETVEVLPLAEEPKKEKKIKKKKKVKYVKKKAKRYFYDPYLNRLENDKGIGEFDYRYKFGAQISYDIGYVDVLPESYENGRWRRARVYHKGSFFDKSLFYEIEYEFTNDGKFKDLFVGYKNKLTSLNTNYRIKYGQIKVPFSLEKYTSSKYTMFMERGLSDSYADARKVGAELLLSSKLGDSRVNLFASVFSNSLDEREDQESDKKGYSFRATYGYKFNKNHLLSIGGAVMGRELNGEKIKYKQGAESDFMREKYVSVKVKDVDSSYKTNIEALYINNKFSIQGEYTTLTLDALTDSYSFDAYYIQTSYFVIGTGRKYRFKNSTLGRIKPNKDGALEVAFRYSSIDLNDKDEVGGTQSDCTYGLNWYVSKELKFTLNYVVAKPEGTDDYDGLFQVLQARALFSF